ncbi:hypothetical protein PGB90_005200 [Kerria lacca]
MFYYWPYCTWLSLFALHMVIIYNALCTSCATFDLFSVYYTGIFVTMIEMLGKKKLVNLYSISLFVNGTLQLIDRT